MRINCHQAEYDFSFFCISFFLGSLSEQAKPLLKTSGSDAKFEWTLLYQNISLFTVSLDGNLTLFYTSLSNPGNVYVDEKYTNRLNKSDIKLDKSVTFVLKNVSAADAGRYICIEGLNSHPSIPDCGQMLVIIGEIPSNNYNVNISYLFMIYYYFLDIKWQHLLFD